MPRSPAPLGRMASERPTVLTRFEACAFHDHPHCLGQAFEPVVEVFFRDFALSLLLVAVCRIAQPKQPGVFRALFPKERREKV